MDLLNTTVDTPLSCPIAPTITINWFGLILFIYLFIYLFFFI